MRQPRRLRERPLPQLPRRLSVRLRRRLRVHREHESLHRWVIGPVFRLPAKQRRGLGKILPRFVRDKRMDRCNKATCHSGRNDEYFVLQVWSDVFFSSNVKKDKRRSPLLQTSMSAALRTEVAPSRATTLWARSSVTAPRDLSCSWTQSPAWVSRTFQNPAWVSRTFQNPAWVSGTFTESCIGA